MLRYLASVVTIYITVLWPSLPGKMALNSGYFLFLSSFCFQSLLVNFSEQLNPVLFKCFKVAVHMLAIDTLKLK